MDAILEYSQNPQTKYYALQILEQLVLTRWRALPRQQCEGEEEEEEERGGEGGRVGMQGSRRTWWGWR